MWRWAQQGLLPWEGALLNQPARLIEAFNWITTEMANAQA